MPAIDADQRYYNQAGRFFSPDPAGMKGASPSSPGSWNRYSYANTDPVNFGDPNGAAPCSVDGFSGNPCPALATGDGGFGMGPTSGDPCDPSVAAENGLFGMPPEPCFDPTTAGPPPPPPAARESCSISFDYRGITGLPYIGGVGAGHGYLAVTTGSGSYVVEGYVVTTQSSPNSLPVDHLDAERTINGHYDNPATDSSYGKVEGAFVFGWLSTLDAARAKINADNVVYNKTGPNSNTALFYMLSQLPTHSRPGLANQI